MSSILNAKNTPLNANSGTVPNVSGALLNWFQKMVFGLVTKTIQDFQVIETVVQINFMGVIQPLSGRQLMMKPEGQRQWNWIWVHSDISLNLKIDDVIIYLETQYRVMTKKDYNIYGYIEWTLVNDYTNSGPTS